MKKYIKNILRQAVIKSYLNDMIKKLENESLKDEPEIHLNLFNSGIKINATILKKKGCILVSEIIKKEMGKRSKH